MAQRRMFSPKVTSTDVFLDMPVSARELYFQLGMNADDDGFITPKRIMRMVGASADDLNVLISRNFVIPFHSGVIVITAWRVNNLVRKDWYQETIYQDEKKQLLISENGEYKLVNEMLPNSLTDIILGKVILGKDRLNKKRYGSLRNVDLTESEYNTLVKEYGNEIINKYIESLSTYIPNRKKTPYKNHNAVIRNWLNKDSIKKAVNIEVVL